MALAEVTRRAQGWWWGAFGATGPWVGRGVENLVKDCQNEAMPQGQVTPIMIDMVAIARATMLLAIRPVAAVFWVKIRLGPMIIALVAAVVVEVNICISLAKPLGETLVATEI